MEIYFVQAMVNMSRKELKKRVRIGGKQQKERKTKW
jgi:hypothetical protein